MFEAKSYLHDKQQSISQNKHQGLGLGRNSAGQKKKMQHGEIGTKLRMKSGKPGA